MMMTLEMKIKKVLDDYDDAKKRLAHEYTRRLDNVPVNEAGEADGDYILETNRWFEKKEAELRNMMVKGIMDASRD